MRMCVVWGMTLGWSSSWGMDLDFLAISHSSLLVFFLGGGGVKSEQGVDI